MIKNFRIVRKSRRANSMARTQALPSPERIENKVEMENSIIAPISFQFSTTISKSSQQALNIFTNTLAELKKGKND